MSQNRTLAWTITFAIGLLASAGCAEMGRQHAGGFSYQPFPVATGSGTAGDGQSVTFKGKPLAMTGGPGIKVGDSLREVKLAKTDLSLVSLTETKGKVRIVSIVPSLDTKVCEQQTHYLSEKNAGLDQGIELITVSVDTPFAQSRFAKDAHIENITFLSDYRGGDFGKTYGLLVKDVHILARTVMVVDKENVIRYLQITPELAQMPDMEAAFNAARGLLGKG